MIHQHNLCGFKRRFHIHSMHYANPTKKWKTCKRTSVIPHVQLHMRQGRKVKSSTGDVYIYDGVEEVL